MLPETTPEDFSDALDTVAADALALIDPAVVDRSAAVDALALASALGIAVAWDDRQQGRGRVVRLRQHEYASTERSILLRHDPRPERLHWAAAHEIGELLAMHVFDRLAVDPREAPPTARETVANQLAGRLLLPREAFSAVGRECDWDLYKLKSRFATASHELIARRMLDVCDSLTITIFDHGRKSFRRGNFLHWPRALDPDELLAWQTAHDSSIPAEDSNHRFNVRVWPIHEPAWKREIVRARWHNVEGCDETA